MPRLPQPQPSRIDAFEVAKVIGTVKSPDRTKIVLVLENPQGEQTGLLLDAEMAFEVIDTIREAGLHSQIQPKAGH